VTLDAAGTANVLDPNSPDPRLILLTIDHESMPAPEHFAQNFEDVVSNGITYQASGFEIELPTDDDGVPRGTLRLGQVTPEIWQIVDPLSSPPVLTIQIVLASEPDAVQRAFTFMEVRRLTGSILTLEADFSHENLAAEPYPGRRLTPSVFTWLNRQG
jgi:hypothetical protein